MNERLMNVDEAAAMLGRTPFAIYRLVERRQIPYRKHGRRLMFLQSEIQAVMDSLPGVSLEDIREREHATF